MELVEVAKVQQVPPDGGLVVEIEGEEIALFLCSDGLRAVQNICPHRGGPLSEGELKDDIVRCPWHDWTFDLRSGLCTINPAARLRRYELEIRGDRVFLAWDGKGEP